MDQKQENLLKEVMAADFTVTDLLLYLDTHPCDQKAIAIYNSSVQRSLILRHEYERLYGPIIAQLTPSKFPWQWVQGKWPWEK